MYEINGCYRLLDSLICIPLPANRMNDQMLHSWLAWDAAINIFECISPLRLARALC